MTSPDRRPSTVDAAAVQRRTLRVVVATQVLGGAGLAAGVTVGALLAAQLLGGPGYAGLSAAALTLGSALAAFVVGRLAQRHGRRPALGAGFLAGGAGALGVVLAGATASPLLLFASLFVYGAGSATNLQTRYAGADLAPPQRRGTAVSLALVATTLGAVAGPNLVTPTGSLAVALGLPALVGPFLLAAVAYLAAGAVLTVFLRPDPLLLARGLRVTSAAPDAPAAAAPVRGGAGAGAAVMLVGQIAMTAIMTMTPVHMRLHDASLADVGLVIGLHIAAMYLPSPLTGMLVDRLGRIRTAVAGAVALLLAGVAAGTLAASLGSTILALVLLGLGWNLGLISGTAMVVDATTEADRAQVQGTIDVLVALAGAGGSAVSGAVMAASGYADLSLVSGGLALLLLPVLVLHARTRRPAAA